MRAATTPGLGVLAVGHVSVNCWGWLEETRAFYAEIVGLPEAFRPEVPGVPGYWFDAGATQLHLVGAPLLHPEAHRPRAPADAAGARAIDPAATHSCFMVTDLEAARMTLEAAEISYLEGSQEHPHGTVLQLWCCDPAGNIIELQQAR